MNMTSQNSSWHKRHLHMRESLRKMISVRTWTLRISSAFCDVSSSIFWCNASALARSAGEGDGLADSASAEVSSRAGAALERLESNLSGGQVQEQKADNKTGTLCGHLEVWEHLAIILNSEPLLIIIWGKMQVIGPSLGSTPLNKNVSLQFRCILRWH